MQVKLFYVPIMGGEEAEEQLNRFLRGNRVLKIEKAFSQLAGLNGWSFCVEYLQGTVVTKKQQKKVDYKNELSPAVFKRFERYRKIRRTLAKEDAVAAFIVFTNKQLADMAKVEKLTLAAMQKISAVGPKRIEKYGARFLKALEL